MMVAGDAKRIALERFAQKFNCAESVLIGLAEANGLGCECIPRIATGFGGGVGGSGEACGALTGAVMALGLKFGRERADDLDSKNLVAGKTRELFAQFEKEFGSVRCFDLTDCDMRTAEGMARAKELDLHNKFCPKFVGFAAEIAQRLMDT